MSTAKAGRLLIAGDDPNLLAAYVLFFEAYGYTTQTATDGLGALATYCASNPDIVMLDIQMPPMDGHAMAREIRRLSVVSSPLLLAVTALCAPADRADPLKAGFDDHFVKPAQLPAILAAMVSHTIIWADRIGQKSARNGPPAFGSECLQSDTKRASIFQFHKCHDARQKTHDYSVAAQRALAW